MPVVSRSGEVHGGLFFGHEQPGVFTPEAEEIVMGIAAHAAIAIDNSRLYHAEKHLSAIVETSDDAIVSKDLNGVVTSWNKGAEHIFGYTARGMIGKPVTIVIPPDRQDEEPEILRRIRRGECVDHYETVRLRKDGSLIDVSLSISPVKDASGIVIGASKIARDISRVSRPRRSTSCWRARSITVPRTCSPWSRRLSPGALPASKASRTRNQRCWAGCTLWPRRTRC